MTASEPAAAPTRIRGEAGRKLGGIARTEPPGAVRRAAASGRIPSAGPARKAERVRLILPRLTALWTARSAASRAAAARTAAGLLVHVDEHPLVVVRAAVVHLDRF